MRDILLAYAKDDTLARSLDLITDPAHRTLDGCRSPVLFLNTDHVLHGESCMDFGNVMAKADEIGYISDMENLATPTAG